MHQLAIVPAGAVEIEMRYDTSFSSSPTAWVRCLLSQDIAWRTALHQLAHYRREGMTRAKKAIPERSMSAAW